MSRYGFYISAAFLAFVSGLFFVYLIMEKQEVEVSEPITDFEVLSVSKEKVFSTFKRLIFRMTRILKLSRA